MAPPEGPAWRRKKTQNPGEKKYRERKLAPPEGPARRMGNVSVLRSSCEFLGLFRLRFRRIRARSAGSVIAELGLLSGLGSWRARSRVGREGGMRFPEASLALGRVCFGGGMDPSSSMDARGIPGCPAPSHGCLGYLVPIHGCSGYLAPTHGCSECLGVSGTNPWIFGVPQGAFPSSIPQARRQSLIKSPGRNEAFGALIAEGGRRSGQRGPLIRISPA